MTNNIFMLEDAAISSEGEMMFAPGVVRIVLCQASWCGHCKDAKPEFQKAADQLSGSRVVFCTIDCSGGGDASKSHKDLVSRLGKLFEVRGYPTYLVFDTKGNFIKDFKITSRNVDGLVAAIKPYL